VYTSPFHRSNVPDDLAVSPDGSQVFVGGGSLRTYPADPAEASRADLILVYDTATGKLSWSRNLWPPKSTSPSQDSLVASNSQVFLATHLACARSSPTCRPGTTIWITTPPSR
jgi:outer membrane protein assembly factor BamB